MIFISFYQFVSISYIFPLFSYWPGRKMAIMYFCLVLWIILHVGLNRWTVSSSYRRRGLPSGCFRTFGYHIKPTRVHLLSLNLATCPASYNFCFWYSKISSFTPFNFQITSLQMCSRNDITIIYFFCAAVKIITSQYLLELLIIELSGQSYLPRIPHSNKD